MAEIQRRYASYSRSVEGNTVRKFYNEISVCIEHDVDYLNEYIDDVWSYIN